MGTRNLTVIIKDNKIRLSQYGQWDGYFSYTGKKFLEFVKNKLQRRSKSDYEYVINDFKEIVDILQPVNENYVDMAHQACKDMQTDTVQIPFKNMFAQFSRDTGVSILDIVGNLRPYELTERVLNKKTKEYDRKQLKYPVYLTIQSWDAEFINVLDLDNEKVYMLTYHDFNGEKQEVPEVVSNTYPMPCWYSHDIKTLPSVKAIQKYKEEIGLDYWQNETTGEWISN